MQQQIQINQPAQQFLAEAAAYFARRRAKVTDRTDQGFRFGFEGSEAQEGGRVTVAPSAGAASAVTVEAEGLGVMAIAEGFIRELRKQARDAGRQGRGNGGTNVGSGFSDLRQRLGMPEAPLAAPPRPPASRPDRPLSPSGPPPGSPMPGATAIEGAGSALPLGVASSGESNGGAGASGESETDAADQGAEAAARPTAVGADATPAVVPQEADPAGSAVSAAAAVSEMHHNSAVMPPAGTGAPASDPAGPGAAPLPHRDMATSAGDAAATTSQAPGHESLTSSPPTAEQLGGVPEASDVHVGPDRGATPGRQTTGPAAGEAAGEAAPPER